MNELKDYDIIDIEAKMYMASLPHFVDGELHILREGENT